MSAASAVPVDSKSGKKRKTKTEAAAVASPAGRASPSVDSGVNGHTMEQINAMESPYLKEIAKYAVHQLISNMTLTMIGIFETCTRN